MKWSTKNLEYFLFKYQNSPKKLFYQNNLYLDTVEHGPELGQPVGVHGGGGVHVLLGGHDELVVDLLLLLSLLLSW